MGIQDEVDVCTYGIQVESLRSFLQAIGYTTTRNSTTRSWHIEKCSGLRNCNPNFISLDVAVSLHNGNLLFSSNICWVLYSREQGLCLTKEAYTNARDNRLLKTVFLQRKKGEWHVRKDLIEFHSIVEEGY
jgi:hypothetical protein